MSRRKLPRAFYMRDDVVTISRELLGKFLFTRVDGKLTGGIIVETEAYRGTDDRACHAYNNRFTKRNAVMHGPGGYAYVYLCYGIHHLFNIVVNRAGQADAVLVRAIEPTHGVEVMLQRRGMAAFNYRLTSGPGSVSRALGITTQHYGVDLLGSIIWLEDRGVRYGADAIVATPRVGVEYAGEHARYPWRFFVKDSRWVSQRG
ncbi:MAG: DNA-3-methyladenine glycosylase [Chitinophagales bacterium]|nr:MAG: DNA-3-methyladenine glycosylase [Chitinophagales bacterium]